MTCPDELDLCRLADGGCTRAEEARLAGHLAACARCSATCDELRTIARDLARDPLTALGDDDAPDLAAAVLRRAALPPRRSGAARVLALATSAAAGLCVGVALQQFRAAPQHGGAGLARVGDVRQARVVDEAGFQARGGGDDPDRWIALRPYAAGPSSPPRPLAPGAQVGDGERLLFAYDNGGARPYRHLAVVGVDGSGRLQWFHPEHRVGAVSIDAQAGRARELSDAIGAELSGPVRIYAVFSDEPLATVAIEAALARVGPDGRLPLAGTGQHRFDVVIAAE